MSGDWFEEAISELDDVDPAAESDITLEELSDELGEELSEEFDEKFDEPTENGVPGGQTQDTAVGTDESIPDETEQDSGDTADTVDNADDTADTVDNADGTGDETGSDPFGFDSGGNEGADTQSSTESDANTGNTDEFGFGSGETADDPTPADDATPAGPTDQQSSTQRESSTAQSADEFGFSIDETDDSSPSEPATGAQPDVSAPESTPAAQPNPTESVDDEADDDPFGFGTGGGAGGDGGASTPAVDGNGDDEFGFGGFGGGGGGGGGTPSPSGPEEFDDDEFESNIDRIDLGIDGLDNMILGGVPERSLIGVIGGAGTGKTTFALQFLNQALKQDERAVFITLEQTEEAVLSTAEEKGWPFRQYVEDDLLTIVVLDPVEMANSLASIRGDISRLIREFGATRLVLDSVSLLEMMYDHPAKRRSEIFDFTRSLKEAGVTTLLTSEASEDSSHASRYGAVEYLTDAVFVLRYVRTSNFEETRMAIEIQKIRDANHSRATKPYDLTDEGMSVHRQANIF